MKICKKQSNLIFLFHLRIYDNTDMCQRSPPCLKITLLKVEAKKWNTTNVPKHIEIDVSCKYSKQNQCKYLKFWYIMEGDIFLKIMTYKNKRTQQRLSKPDSHIPGQDFLPFTVCLQWVMGNVQCEVMLCCGSAGNKFE